MEQKNRKVYIDRLLYLAREVAKEKYVRWYFGTYAGHDWKGDPKMSCGTNRCAIGLASTLPRFRRIGLELRRTRDNSWMSIRPAIRGCPIIMRGVPEIFGLKSDEYDALFAPDSAPNYLPDDATAKEVADQIRSFVKFARKGKEAEWMAG